LNCSGCLKCASLRRLKKKRETCLPATLDELETQSAQSVGSLDAGWGVNGKIVSRRFCKRIKEVGETGV